MYLTLDEAIDHAEEVANEQKKKACNLYDAKNYEASRECVWCSEEHRQLAEWLNELKQLREQTRWIPVSEKMPKPQKNGDKDYSDWLEVTILIGKNKDAYVGEAYYCFSENKWYAKRFAVGEVTAWKPLSEPYKTESEE